MIAAASTTRARPTRSWPRILRRLLVPLALLWGAATLVATMWLPRLLLDAPIRRRTSAEREAILASLRPADARWTEHQVHGGQGMPLTLHWLHRPASRGVVVLLHGFGDDGFGTAPGLRNFPEWDACVFTFRGRDLHPDVPSTLGGWERYDVQAVVRFLERQGIARSHVVLVGASQGAGIALLALAELERAGGRVGGALLESPFADLFDATRNHLRGMLGHAEPIARPAERLALLRAGRLASFDPSSVSPARASVGLRTPIAILAGDADPITPIDGVRRIGRYHRDLTVVHGAGHLQASAAVPGGYRAWAHARLVRWGLE